MMTPSLRITGDLDGTIAKGQQALELAAALGDSALQGKPPIPWGKCPMPLATSAGRPSCCGGTWRLRTGCRVRPVQTCGSSPGHGRHTCQALDLARQQKERGHEALALHQLGVVHAHADSPDPVQAEALYRQALALAEVLGMRPLLAHCHRGLGTLHSQTGQAEQARAELSTAIDMYRDMEMTFWLPETEAALAAVESA
jgi:hypothetical protein